MEKHHLVHMGVGCLLAAALFVVLMFFGAGMQWATAAFIAAMAVCHVYAAYYLLTKDDNDTQKEDAQ